MYIYKNQRFKPDENSDIKLLFDKNKNMRWFVDNFNEIKNYNLSVMMDKLTYCHISAALSWSIFMRLYSLFETKLIN